MAVARRIPELKYVGLVIAGFKVDCREYFERGDLVIRVTLDADDKGPYDAYEIAHKDYKGQHGPGEIAKSKEDLEESFKLIQDYCFFAVDSITFVPDPGQPLEMFQSIVQGFLLLSGPNSYVNRLPEMREVRKDEE